MVSAPTIELNNGTQMPALGLGTYLIKGGEGISAIENAIDIGYRHFDTAFLYTSERELGEAINNKIEKKDIKREDVFIVTKLWNTYHDPEHVEDACRKSLQNLELEYIDLYLMHFPVSFAYRGDGVPWPRISDNDQRNATNDIDYLDTWKAMESLVDKNLVKCIGLSNFNSEQVKRVVDNARIKPVVNQIECSPVINQKPLTAFCKELGVAIVAYMPLGPKDLMNRPEIKTIAAKFNKTGAQIILRYLFELGVTPIPKTTHAERLLENISIFDFKLTEEDRKIMDGFNTNERQIKLSTATHAVHYPFNLEF